MTLKGMLLATWLQTAVASVNNIQPLIQKRPGRVASLYPHIVVYAVLGGASSTKRQREVNNRYLSQEPEGKLVCLVKGHKMHPWLQGCTQCGEPLIYRNGRLEVLDFTKYKSIYDKAAQLHEEKSQQDP